MKGKIPAILGTKTNTLVFGIFIVGLIIRLFFWAIVVYYNAPTQFDESGYFEIGSRYDRILDTLISGDLPTRQYLKGALKKGGRPPLPGVLYGLAIFLSFSDDRSFQVAVVRLFNVLVSSTIIVVLFVTTKRLINQKAGLISAGVFAVYPSFVAYSHYIYVTNLYVLFLMLSICFFFMSKDKQRFAILSGLFLALSGLIHARTLLLLVFLPIWALYEGINRRSFKRAALIAGTIGLVILPWIIILSILTGKLTPLSNQGGVALYNGNNPMTHLEIGATGKDKKEARQVALAYAEEQDISLFEAMNTLAREEIKNKPALFILRSLSRLRILWAHDTYLIRYILMGGYYPPISVVGVCILWGLSILAYLFLVIAIFYGILCGHFQKTDYKIFLLLFVAISCIIPVISVTYTRYNIPLQVILLPFVGSIWATRDNTNSKQKPWKIVATLAFAVFALWVVIGALQPTFEHHIQSAAYGFPIDERYEKIVEFFEGDSNH